MDRLALALAVVVGVPLVLVGYVSLVEGVLRALPSRAAGLVRPWLWIAPGAFFLAVFLIYPTIETIHLSFLGPDSTEPVGLANYQFVFTDPGMLISLRNSGL